SGDWLKTITADPTNGRIENSSGYDIIFKDSSDTQLDHEIESYDGTASGGILVAWVRIPTLSYNTDTVIYMYYGNTCVSSSQENAYGVWDSNYVGVWHLKETGNGTVDEFKDSTSNVNHGQGGDGTSGYVPAQVAGKISYGQEFDGLDDYIGCGNASSLNITGTAITVEAWVQLQEVRPASGTGIVKKGNQYFLFQDWDADYRITFTADSPTQAYPSADGNLADTWYHMVGVYNGSNAKIYRNGTEVGSLVASGSIVSSASDVVIGGNQAFDGPIDEARISNIVRSPDWIATSYNNQNNPSNFYNVGNEEEVVGVSLAEHAAGQESDQFGSTGTVTGAELFAFKFTNTEVSQVTVDSVQFQLSSVTGIDQGDFSSLEIYVDSDNDGTIEAGETTTVGGSGVVNAGVTTITFSTAFNISGGTTVNYILKGDVTNLVGSDTVTIDLGTGNVTLSSGSVSGTAPTSVTHTSDVPCEYSSWRQITIDNTKVSGTSDLSNFPLLVSLSGDWLKTTTADPINGRITNNNGYDIIFKDTGGTQLDHEIEDYDGTNGTLIAWVRIPTLSYNTDTVIYIYYGNSCISSSQENVTGVWDSNYKGVWHFKETPTVDSYAYDSTSNNNDGTFEASMTAADQAAGQINGSLDFEGTDDYVDSGNGASLIIYNSDFTWEAWAKLDAKAQDREVISKAGDEVTVFPIELRYDLGEDNWQFNVNDGAWQYAKYTQAAPQIDTWYHIVGVRDGSTIRIYINGVEGAVTDTIGTLTDSSAFSLYIGRLLAPSDPRHFDGQIDEARVSNIVRSADWILTEYNNQNDPSTFYSIGDEGAGCSYSHRKSITILSSQVSGTADHSNFPLLVNLTDANLRHIDSGGHVTNTNGYDIIFRASDETTQLDHEIEEYDETNGTVVAWVRIPTLSYDTNTVIYMYYGNTCISTSQENVTGVWDSNYLGVWHLKESGNGTVDEFTDSTSNDNHGQGGEGTGSQVPTQSTSGKIANAQDFDASDCISVPNSSSLQPTTAITLSGWIKLRSFGAGSEVDPLLRKGPGNPNNYQLMLDDSTPQFVLNSGDDDTPIGSTTLLANNWYYLAGTWETSGSRTVYLNGSSDGTGAFTGPINTDTRPLYMGGRADANDHIDGLLDELRISNILRSADWIQTEYNNQSNPSTFYNEGSEESAGTVSLGNHAAGQEADKFTTESSVTGAELFAFKLTNTTDSTVTVKKVLFPLSSVTGISQGDFANLELYVDANNDGTVGGGETTTVGGTGVVNAGVTDITFSTDFAISANTTVNYIMKGDVSNLVGNDTVTIDLGTSNVTINAGHVGGSAPTSATHTSDAGCEYSSWRQITIDNTKVSGLTTNTWQVAANNRDAWDDTSSGSLNACLFGDSTWNDAGGYQFAATIPQGATIISAKLKVYSFSHGGATGAYTARINIEDVDSASVFAGTANDIFGRSYYTTTVDWSIPAAGLDTGTWTDSPDLTDLVQHIVNKPGWSSGNYLSIAVWGVTSNGGCSEDIRDFNDDTSLAAKLEVTYQDGSGSHQNFPLLVNLSGDWLKTTTADTTNGRIQNANGYDIIFKDTSGTQLDHEIESYDGSASGGTLVAWVRIPTLSYDTDTVIYMYYGNSCISSSQENVTGVWDDNYVGVWHLSETPDTDGGTDEILESNNNNDGDSQNMASNDQVPGQIDGSLDFDGSDDYIDITVMNPRSYDAFTISAWYKSTDASVSDDEYIYNHHTDLSNEIMFGPTDDASHTDQLRLFIQTSAGGSNYNYSTTDVVDQTWHYLTGVRTSAGRIKIYVDGIEELDDPGAIFGTIGPLDGMGPWIGDDPTATDHVHGMLDEVRISDTDRS
ncbi:MAG: DUF2341 domain-containing protein, partial [Planctomycetota bacterium]